MSCQSFIHPTPRKVSLICLIVRQIALVVIQIYVCMGTPNRTRMWKNLWGWVYEWSCCIAWHAFTPSVKCTSILPNCTGLSLSPSDKGHMLKRAAAHHAHSQYPHSCTKFHLRYSGRLHNAQVWNAKMREDCTQASPHSKLRSVTEHNV